MSDDYTHGDNFDYDNALVDEIERLTAELDRALAALEAVKQIADENLMGLTNKRIQDAIRAALTAKEKP